MRQIDRQSLKREPRVARSNELLETGVIEKSHSVTKHRRSYDESLAELHRSRLPRQPWCRRLGVNLFHRWARPSKAFPYINQAAIDLSDHRQIQRPASGRIHHMGSNDGLPYTKDRPVG